LKKFQNLQTHRGERQTETGEREKHGERRERGRRALSCQPPNQKDDRGNRKITNSRNI